MKSKHLSISTFIVCAFALGGSAPRAWGQAATTAAVAESDDNAAALSNYANMRLPIPGGEPYLFTTWHTSAADRSRDVPQACARMEDVFMNGFRDGMNGRRFLIPLIAIDGWPKGGANDPNLRDRQACTNLPSEEATYCCRRGFAAGTRSLARLIPAAWADSPQDDQCRNAYRDGQATANQVCRAHAPNSTTECPRPPTRQVYLGCFHLGFNHAAASCTNETSLSTSGRDFESFAHISTIREPARADGPTGSGSGSRRPSAAGSASGGGSSSEDSTVCYSSSGAPYSCGGGR